MYVKGLYEGGKNLQKVKYTAFTLALVVVQLLLFSDARY